MAQFRFHLNIEDDGEQPSFGVRRLAAALDFVRKHAS
jgi:hypothetical protein